MTSEREPWITTMHTAKRLKAGMHVITVKHDSGSGQLILSIDGVLTAIADCRPLTEIVP